HRVEVLADDAARFHARVQADPRPGRWAEHRDGTRGGQEVGAGVLAVDPELDGVPAYWWVVVAERFTGGDTEHLTHQVDAGDLLGDRMLDLQPGIDFEERDGAVLSDEKLAGTRTHVAGLAENRLG